MYVYILYMYICIYVCVCVCVYVYVYTYVYIYVYIYILCIHTPATDAMTHGEVLLFDNTTEHTPLALPHTDIVNEIV